MIELAISAIMIMWTDIHLEGGIVDTLTRTQRSERMSRVRSQNTKPELIVRRLVHKMGYRYRLHRRELPGVPDLVFPGRRTIIFVHGCFWHGHACKRAKLPATHRAFWREKQLYNRKRDSTNLRRLRRLGWKVTVVWECQLRDLLAVQKRLLAFLEGN